MYRQAKELKALFYCLLVKSKLDTPMSATKLNRKNNQSKLSTDLVRAYLHELGQIPLLNHYEEIRYGQQVQRMMSYLAEMIEDDSADPEDYATFKLMRQDVRKMLSELNPKEREVISLRFGARRWPGIVLSEDRSEVKSQSRTSPSVTKSSPSSSSSKTSFSSAGLSC